MHPPKNSNSPNLLTQKRTHKKPKNETRMHLDVLPAVPQDANPVPQPVAPPALVDGALEGVEGGEYPPAGAPFQPQQPELVPWAPQEGAGAEAAGGAVLC